MGGHWTLWSGLTTAHNKAVKREEKRVHNEKEGVCKATEREALKAQRGEAKTAPALIHVNVQ